MTPHQTNNIYTVDYKRLVLLLLPTFLRKTRIFTLCSLLASGIKSLHYQFESNRVKNINRLQYNGQVCYLQKLLNDELDNKERRITITDNPRAGEWLFIYDQAGMNQTLIHTLPGERAREVPILWNETTIDQDAVSFTVNVPANTGIDIRKDSDLKKLQKLLNEYKLISQKYEIKQ